MAAGPGRASRVQEGAVARIEPSRKPCLIGLKRGPERHRWGHAFQFLCLHRRLPARRGGRFLPFPHSLQPPGLAGLAHGRQPVLLWLVGSAISLADRRLHPVQFPGRAGSLVVHAGADDRRNHSGRSAWPSICAAIAYFKYANFILAQSGRGTAVVDSRIRMSCLAARHLLLHLHPDRVSWSMSPAARPASTIFVHYALFVTYFPASDRRPDPPSQSR